DADGFVAAGRGETGEDFEYLGDDLARREFISGDLHRVRIRDVDVDSPFGEGGAQFLGPALYPEGDGVDEVRLEYGDAPFVRPGRDRPGVLVHAGRDRVQAIGPVIDRVHRGHHREQHLRGADVRGRLLAADMLFPGLQGEAVGHVPACVFAHADETAGKLAFQS